MQQWCWVTKYSDLPSDGISAVASPAFQVPGALTGNPGRQGAGHICITIFVPWVSAGLSPPGWGRPAHAEVRHQLAPAFTARSKLGLFLLLLHLLGCPSVSDPDFPSWFSSAHTSSLSDFPAAGPAAAPPRSGGRTACGSTRSTSGWTTTWGRWVASSEGSTSCNPGAGGLDNNVPVSWGSFVATVWFGWVSAAIWILLRLSQMLYNFKVHNIKQVLLLFWNKTAPLSLGKWLICWFRPWRVLLHTDGTALAVQLPNSGQGGSLWKSQVLE